MLLNPDTSSLDQHKEILIEIEKFFSPCPVFYLFSPKSINRKLANNLYTNKNSVFSFTGDCNETELVLILDSPGGDIHAAYNIIKIIRKHCSRLKVVVPRWAKSAATLICLAADEIIMSDIAELGPLDPQIRRPGETSFKSVLDEYLAFDALRKETITSLDILIPLLSGRTGMDIKDLLKPAFTFVSDLMNPVYSQVDPLAHGSHMRNMDVSKQYARRVMEMYGPISGDDIYEITEHFSKGYPSHDFIIDVQELNELGLSAREFTPEEDKVLLPLVELSQKVTLIGALTNEINEYLLAEKEAAAKVISEAGVDGCLNSDNNIDNDPNSELVDVDSDDNDEMVGDLVE